MCIKNTHIQDVFTFSSIMMYYKTMVGIMRRSKYPLRMNNLLNKFFRFYCHFARVHYINQCYPRLLAPAVNYRTQSQNRVCGVRRSSNDVSINYFTMRECARARAKRCSNPSITHARTIVCACIILRWIQLGDAPQDDAYNLCKWVRDACLRLNAAAAAAAQQKLHGLRGSSSHDHYRVSRYQNIVICTAVALYVCTKHQVLNHITGAICVVLNTFI